MAKFTIEAKGAWNTPTVKPDEVVALVGSLFSKDMCSPVEIQHAIGLVDRRALSRSKKKIQIFIGAIARPKRRRIMNPRNWIGAYNERRIGPYTVGKGLYYSPILSVYDHIVYLNQEARETALAGIVRNSIFIFNGLNSSAPGDEMELLRYTLRKAIIAMNLNTESTDEEITEIITRYITNTCTNIKDEIQVIENKIVTEKQQLTTLYIEQAHCKEKLSIIESCTLNEMTKKTKDMLYNTRRIPGIKFVKLSHGALTLFTDTIMVKDPRTNIIHEIGKFMITVDTRNGRTTFENKTRRITGHQPNMHAPHVFADGHACWGNLEGVVPIYISKWEIEAVAIACMEFLRSVNVSDVAGAHINNWPTAKEKV